MPSHSKSPPIKSHWLSLAIEIHNFHVYQCKSESNWTLRDTSKALNRSLGSVSENIHVASWLKTHEKAIKKCNSLKDALQLVKNKEREIKLVDID